MTVSILNKVIDMWIVNMQQNKIVQEFSNVLKGFAAV